MSSKYKKLTFSTDSEKITAIVKSINCLKYSALDSPSQIEAADLFTQEEIMHSVLMNMANFYLTLLKAMTIEELNKAVAVGDFDCKFEMDKDNRLMFVKA